MVQAITIEREFGCGASEIASLVATRLGWSLWDERLTQEIARLTESTPEAVEQENGEPIPLSTGFSRTSFGARLREACRPPTGCTRSMRAGSRLFRKQLSRQRFPAVRR
jgi:hypothetical protein